jgi:hypothetical protein
MKVARTCAVGIAAAFLISAIAAASNQQASDPDRKVAGGGVTAKGWMGKEDAGNKQGLTVNDSKFAAEGSGFRVTTGPAALYWNPASVAKGDYTVKATFTEPKQTINHPHPFGVFIGGSSLDSGAPTALYCTAYRNGNFIIRGFNNGKRFDVVGRPTPNDAVHKADPEAQVVQEVAWNVRGDKVECVINGTSVWSGTKADVTGDGKLQSTDGIAGIRVSHNSDAIVTNFGVSK